MKKIFYGAGTQEHPYFKKLIVQLPADKSKKIKWQAILSEDSLLEKTPFQVIYPFKKGKGENGDSLTLLARFGALNWLFTGDLDQVGEQNILEKYQELKVDVLKVGHHGSRTSSNVEFIKKSQIKYGLISCGRNNRYGHPHQEVLDGLKKNHVKIYRTDEQGMIQFYWHDNKKGSFRIFIDS